MSNSKKKQFLIGMGLVAGSVTGIVLSWIGKTQQKTDFMKISDFQALTKQNGAESASAEDERIILDPGKTDTL